MPLKGNQYKLDVDGDKKITRKDFMIWLKTARRRKRMEINLPDLPDTDYILVPPKTIFYPPVAEIPYLDPVLLPSLEQVESGLGDQGSSAEEDKASSKEEELQLTPETIPQNQLVPKETLSTEDPVATFNLPFFGEMPIPAPEVIASSIIAAGTASVASVVGGIAMQSVLGFIKKTFKKIFTKVMKKEVANVKEKMDNNKGS